MRRLEVDTPTRGCVTHCWGRMQQESVCQCMLGCVDNLCVCVWGGLPSRVWCSADVGPLREPETVGQTPDCCPLCETGTHTTSCQQRFNYTRAHRNSEHTQTQTYTHTFPSFWRCPWWSALQPSWGSWTFLHFITTGSFITLLPKWTPDGAHCWLKRRSWRKQQQPSLRGARASILLLRETSGEDCGSADHPVVELVRGTNSKVNQAAWPQSKIT